MRTLTCPPAAAAAPAAASDLAQRVTAMAYWQKPLDGADKRQSQSSFGPRLDQTRYVNNLPLSRPMVDLRFNQRGFHSLAWRGAVLQQNQPASGPAPEINWWLVGGIAVGATVVIHEERKKYPAADAPKKGGGF